MTETSTNKDFLKEIQERISQLEKEILDMQKQLNQARRVVAQIEPLIVSRNGGIIELEKLRTEINKKEKEPKE